MPGFLGERRLAHWNENGFLVLPGFCTDEELAAVDAAVDTAWDERPADVVVDDLDTNRRSRICDVSEVERSHRFKVNDLYLRDPAVREVVLSDRLGMALAELLHDVPVVCNTLNFGHGSAQADHLDTLYMTPRSQTGLVATWIALEDTDERAGPLRYYPGSNHIEPYHFETGSMHVHLPEMDRWSEYMAREVSAHGLAETTFAARRGDVFIWHALLLHGGSEILDRSLTRRSIVTHYFTRTDSHLLGSDHRPVPGGFWMQKPPLDIPAQSARDEPPPVDAAAPGRELYERMRPLLTATD